MKIKRYLEYIKESKSWDDLSNRIINFLDEYAVLNPNWDSEYDDEYDKFASPDAAQMKYCVELLSKGEKPSRCWSEWGSGGYKPYISKEGRAEHDLLVKNVYEIINK